MRSAVAWLAVGIVTCVMAVRGRAEDDSVVGAARVHVRAAQEAGKAGRAQAALESWLAAYALRPQHGGIAFELALAYAAVGRLDDAARTLQVVDGMGFPLRADEGEAARACRAHAACGAALAGLARHREPKASSALAFTFAGPGLVPEGLAYDPSSDTLFVSSVRQRLVLRLDRSRRPRPFADRSAGLWAALGMAVDAPRRRLWVATAALDEMGGAAAGDKGRSALVALDLDSGRPVARHELPAGRPHVLGDVIVTPDGDVLSTDSQSPAVYRLAAGGAALETIAAGEPFVSPQGLALSPDRTRLYVADYAKGIFAIDLASRRVRLLAAPPTAGILGIDGLYLAGGRLLAVQNGTDPPRLLRIAVDGDRIASVEVLDSGHPAAPDPTLGVVAGDRFLYIGNSQWAAARAGGEMDPKVKPEDPVILGLDLRPLASGEQHQ
jgi:sugar lactone lactonase YvrE